MSAGANPIRTSGMPNRAVLDAIAMSDTQTSPKPPPKRGIPSFFARTDTNIIAVFLIVAALAGVAYWAVQYKRKERERTDAANAVPIVTTPANTLTAVSPAPQAAPPQDDSTLRLTLEGARWDA